MSDDQFLAAFEGCTVEEFHHRDHIKVAWLYLRRYPLHEAIAKVRTGLQALAAAWGAPVDDLEKGYHETMTQAWVRLVHLAMNDSLTASSSDAFCDQHPHLMRKSHLESFYSPDRLKSWQAKLEFIEPDLSPFSEYRIPSPPRRSLDQVGRVSPSAPPGVRGSCKSPNAPGVTKPPSRQRTRFSAGARRSPDKRDSHSSRDRPMLSSPCSTSSRQLSILR